MNRFKKYVRKQGYKLESDYEYLPYKGIEAVIVDASHKCIRTYYNFYGWSYTVFNNDGTVWHTDIYTDVYKDDDFNY